MQGVEERAGAWREKPAALAEENPERFDAS